MIRGNSWMLQNDDVQQRDYQLYYLCTLERYCSLREATEGAAASIPNWYEKGVGHLLATQRSDGSWSSRCGEACATAFGVLFLLRAAKRSIQRDPPAIESPPGPRPPDGRAPPSSD